VTEAETHVGFHVYYLLLSGFNWTGVGGQILVKIPDIKYKMKICSMFLIVSCVYMNGQRDFKRHSSGIQMHLMNCVFAHHICPCESILGCLLSSVG